MVTLTIDNQTVLCREGISVLQAALEAGWDVPHYCYHPSLSVVASCRLCMMEMQAPNPKTGAPEWIPRLVPSCQTLVRNGLVVRFDSPIVRENRRRCMEFYLLNHPLDCPVCDQAGECYLQDYSYKYGNATSRMVEEKTKNPKKNIGSKTWLYQDRCILCSRCVRFADEISGTHELTVVNRGDLCEIDVFPGSPLENKLQGNVVDLCPVGALLDKDFLFKQRVWLLQTTNSICSRCSTGCSIRIDQNGNVIYRLRPRFNSKVNDYWMCDEGRFGWKYVHSSNRLTQPKVRSRDIGPITKSGEKQDSISHDTWEMIPSAIHALLSDFSIRHGSDKFAVVLSPMMACEEAWLLIRGIRSMLPQAVLIPGPTMTVGSDECFPIGQPSESAKFTVRSEKVPNRRGIELVIERSAPPTARCETFITACRSKIYRGIWIVGGYHDASWVPTEWIETLDTMDLLIVQDLFPNALTELAHVVLPSCSWAEREGSFMNHSGLLQPFNWAIQPPEGCKRDGQFLYELAGLEGLYNGERVRELMVKQIPEPGSEILIG